MRRTIEGPTVTWIDIQNPVKEDIEYLRDNFAFHPLILQELIPQIWRTKVEVLPTHLFVVLHFPFSAKDVKETRPQELDIVVTKNTIVTSHYHSIIPLKSLFDKCNLYTEAKNKYMTQGAGFLLFYVLNEFLESILSKISHIDRKIEAIERGIFSGKEAEMLKEISFIKADIIDFLKIITPQGKTFESLRERGALFFNQEIEPYFSHLLGHWNQAKNELENYRDTILAFEETNNALLTHKTNQTLRILTTVSVFFLPLTLFVSLFSINTKSLPFSDHESGFWIVFGIMATLALGMIFYFKKRKWI